MIRPTLKKLNELLQDEDLPFEKVTKDHCETYGPKTYAFFTCRHMVQRFRIEQKLIDAGCKVDRRYCTTQGNCSTNSPQVMVQVSYLRAHGWKE